MPPTLLASLRTPDSLYTYGSPRVGDSAFVATLKGLDKHRYVEGCDIVTDVPPKSFGYEHLGEPYYINLARPVKFDPPQTEIDNDRTQAEKEFIERYAWRIGDGPLRPRAGQLCLAGDSGYFLARATPNEPRAA